MAEWTVVHKLWSDDSTLDEVKPIDTDFEWNIGSIGPSVLTYEVSLAMPSMKWGYIGPYRTYWELWNHDYPEPIDAGPHVGYRSQKGSNALQIVGNSWLHELQIRHYPFNPQSPNAFLGGTAANDQGIAYQANKDIAHIINDVLDITFARPNSRGPIFFDNLPIGITQGVRIELADTEFLYDKILTWSQVAPGFEFEVDWQKRLFLYEGNKFIDAARTDPNQCRIIFDKWVVPTDLVEAEFENEGPEMTHILALGAGTSTRLGRALGYEQSQEIFGRIDGPVDFGDTVNQTQLNDQAQHRLSKGLYPRHNLPMSIRTDNIRDFWGIMAPGLPVWIRQDFENANLNSAWSVGTINLKLSKEGEERVTFSNMEEVNEEGRPGVVQG